MRTAKWPAASPPGACRKCTTRIPRAAALNEAAYRAATVRERLQRVCGIRIRICEMVYLANEAVLHVKDRFLAVAAQ